LIFIIIIFLFIFLFYLLYIDFFIFVYLFVINVYERLLIIRFIVIFIKDYGSDFLFIL